MRCREVAVFVNEKSGPLSCDFGDARKPAGIPQSAGVWGGVEWGHRRLISAGEPSWSAQGGAPEEERTEAAQNPCN